MLYLLHMCGLLVQLISHKFNSWPLSGSSLRQVVHTHAIVTRQHNLVPVEDNDIIWRGR